MNLIEETGRLRIHRSEPKMRLVRINSTQESLIQDGISSEYVRGNSVVEVIIVVVVVTLVAVE